MSSARQLTWFQWNVKPVCLSAASTLISDIFFCQVLDRDNQMDNPCAWLPDSSWDNITELEKLANFHGIITSFEQYPRDWKEWFTASEPENTTLPGVCVCVCVRVCVCVCHILLLQ